MILIDTVFSNNIYFFKFTICFLYLHKSILQYLFDIITHFFLNIYIRRPYKSKFISSNHFTMPTPASCSGLLSLRLVYRMHSWLIWLLYLLPSSIFINFPPCKLNRPGQVIIIILQVSKCGGRIAFNCSWDCYLLFIVKY